MKAKNGNLHKYLSIPKEQISCFVRRLRELVKERIYEIDVLVPTRVTVVWGKGFHSEVGDFEADMYSTKIDIKKCSTVKKFISDYDKDLQKFEHDLAELARKYKVNKTGLFDFIHLSMYK